jgi:hypothetical protein
MKNHNAFPVRYYASDRHGWAESPVLAKELWMRLRGQPKYREIRWYAADMEILSPDTLTLYVYDIEDNVYGGIGKRILELSITEFNDREKILLGQAVLAIYTNVAQKKLEEIEQREREITIRKLRKDMFGI